MAAELNPHHGAAPPGLPPDVTARARALCARPEASKNAALPPDEARPEFTSRMPERIEALALRDVVMDPR